ncbi:MAG: glucosamine-6-phosphate deaminase, partial [Chloroflexota bacterium]
MNLPEALAHHAHLSVFPDYAKLSRHAAHLIAATVRRQPEAVISLTTGHTMTGTYRLLVELCRSGALDMTTTRLISSEEYVGVGPDDSISLFGWLRRELFEPCGVPPASVLRLVGDARDPAEECRRFDSAIEELGGIDLVVQSIGPNGHFGFNEPRSPRDALSRMVDLDASTRRSNISYWHDGARVPGRGLTMGVRTTLQARHVLLLASGEKKAHALSRALAGP